MILILPILNEVLRKFTKLARYATLGTLAYFTFVNENGRLTLIFKESEVLSFTLVGMITH